MRRWDDPLCQQTDRIPGTYRCYICSGVFTELRFYRDRTRHNGCGSRCKVCDDHRTALRKADGYYRQDSRNRPSGPVKDRLPSDQVTTISRPKKDGGIGDYITERLRQRMKIFSDNG